MLRICHALAGPQEEDLFFRGLRQTPLGRQQTCRSARDQCTPCLWPTTKAVALALAPVKGMARVTIVMDDFRMTLP